MRRVSGISLLLFSLAAASAVYGANSVLTKYLDFGDTGQAKLLAADGKGNLFAVGLVMESSGLKQIRVIKTDSNGNPLAGFDFGGSGQDDVAGAATDSEGNIIIVGSTDSLDFPLVDSLSSQRLPAGFIVKIDSQMQHILLSRLLGGINGSYSSADAVVLDGSGNIYVAGDTDEVDFPLSMNALQSAVPADPLGVSKYGFIIELSPAGQIVFSTYYSGTHCQLSSVCLGNGTTVPTSIGVDPSGNIIIAGNTNTVDLPTTEGAYFRQCNCSAGFVAKLAPGGSKLQWATLVPPDLGLSATVSILTLALENDGSVVVAGSAAGGVPITAGAVQPAPQFTGAASGFIARLDPTGSTLLFSTYLGGALISSSVGGVRSLAVDVQGLIWATGSSAPPTLFGTFSLGSPYIVSLSADGTQMVSAFTAPQGASGQGIVVTSQSGPVSLGASGSLLLGGSTQDPSLLGIANSAGQQVSGTIAPLMLVSLYGIGIGPSVPLDAQVATIGAGNQTTVSTSLGGVQVTFNGTPAPLLYVGPTQINAVVPIEVANEDVATVEIVNGSATISGPTLRVRPSGPEVFGTSPYSNYYYAGCLNQDGTINSPTNPTTSGSIITIWATGAGLFNPSFTNGTIINPAGVNGFNQLALILPVSVLSYSSDNLEGSSLTSLQVLYGGAAPNTVEGVIQVNFVLPITRASQYRLQIGTALSEAFSVYQK